MSVPDRPDVFTYDDWRAFLQDMIEWFRQSDASFSLRRFSRDSGFKSHTHLVRVLEGGIDLNVDTSQAYAKALKLSIEERFRFTSMIAGHPVTLDQIDVKHNAFFDILVLALLSNYSGLSSPGEMSRRLRGSLTEFEVADILTRLKGQGLVSNSDRGYYKVLDSENVLFDARAKSKLDFSRDMVTLLNRVLVSECYSPGSSAMFFKARPSDIDEALVKVQSVMREEVTRVSEKARDDPSAEFYGLYLQRSVFPKP